MNEAASEGSSRPIPKCDEPECRLVLDSNLYVVHLHAGLLVSIHGSNEYSSQVDAACGLAFLTPQVAGDYLL
jgi:hypothetical protein